MTSVPTVDLDHVAVAVEHRREAWARYRVALGGQWVGGGATAGFANNQFSYANGMKIEILRPHRAEDDDFLRRFLDRSGPGPHHLTYKVADIRVAIDAATAAGYPPVSVNLAFPEWLEAFLHPKASHGVVVQLAESHDEGWEKPPPPDQMPEAGPVQADLVRTVHVVASLDAAATLFEDVLLGEEVAQGVDGRPADGVPAGAGRWRDLAWPGAGRLRLVEPAAGSELAAWLGDRPGAVHHLGFAADDPAAHPDAVRLEGDTFTVAPEHNLGTRLVIHPR